MKQYVLTNAIPVPQEYRYSEKPPMMLTGSEIAEIVRKHVNIGGIYLVPRSFAREIEKLTIEKQNERTT